MLCYYLAIIFSYVIRYFLLLAYGCYGSINIGNFQCSRRVVQSDSSGGDDDCDHDTENPRIVVKYVVLCASDAGEEVFCW